MNGFRLWVSLWLYSCSAPDSLIHVESFFDVLGKVCDMVAIYRYMGWSVMLL